MKTTRTLSKSVVLTSALGIVLAGCGGGPAATESRLVSSPSTSSSGTSGVTASPVTSGGSGTVGLGPNEVADLTNAQVTAMDKKLDSILSETQSANSNAKKAKDNSKLAMIFAGIAGGLLLASHIKTGIDIGKKKGVGHGLLGGLTNSRQTITSLEGTATRQAVATEGSRVIAVASSAETAAKGAETQAASAANRSAANLFVTAALKSDNTKQHADQLTAMNDGFRNADAAAEERTEVVVTTIQPVAERVARVEQDLVDYKAELQSELDSRIALAKELEQKIDTARAEDKDALQKMVQNLNSQIDSIKQNLEKNSVKSDADKAAIQNQIAALDSSMKDINNSLAKVESSVANINMQPTKLEVTLKANETGTATAVPAKAKEKAKADEGESVDQRASQ